MVVSRRSRWVSLLVLLAVGNVCHHLQWMRLVVVVRRRGVVRRTSSPRGAGRRGVKVAARRWGMRDSRGGQARGRAVLGQLLGQVVMVVGVTRNWVVYAGSSAFAAFRW
jgi:hypothetical protein